MAFLKDIQDKIILGRWRFLTLKNISGNTKQLGVDANGILGTVTMSALDIPNLDASKIQTGVFEIDRVNTTLTDYEIGTVGSITPNDTIMEAIAKLEAELVSAKQRITELEPET